MSLAGTWKQVKSENGLAFGTAIGATKEQLEKKSKTTTVLTYAINGNTVTTTRVYTSPGNISFISKHRI